jgi:hypothetical protein
VRELLTGKDEQLQRKLTLLNGLNANTGTASLQGSTLAVSGWGAGHDWWVGPITHRVHCAFVLEL